MKFNIKNLKLVFLVYIINTIFDYIILLYLINLKKLIIVLIVINK